MSFGQEAAALAFYQGWLRERPTIEGANLHWTKLSDIAAFIIGEIDELIEALKLGHPVQVSHEFVDVFVVSSILFLRSGFSPDGHQTIVSISSDEQLSNTLRVMKGAANEIMIRGLSRPLLQQLYSLWKSLENYLLGDQRLSVAFREKLQINGWNRPSEYYQQHDEDGKSLSEQEMYEKYLHSEICLRMIRTHFKQLTNRSTSLLEWMHKPFKEHILSFRQPEAAQAALKIALEQSYRIYQRMLISVIQQIKKGVKVDTRHLEILYLAAQVPGTSDQSVPDPSAGFVITGPISHTG